MAYFTPIHILLAHGRYSCEGKAGKYGLSLCTGEEDINGAWETLQLSVQSGGLPGGSDT